MHSDWANSKYEKCSGLHVASSENSLISATNYDKYLPHDLFSNRDKEIVSNDVTVT